MVLCTLASLDFSFFSRSGVDKASSNLFALFATSTDGLGSWVGSASGCASVSAKVFFGVGPGSFGLGATSMSQMALVSA